ncbi:nucleoside-diphosphate sugar epimerase [Tsuneonella deserti]|uniref:Nucleoside-diphosphate sugar epimerase n=1 Tax=Tsuneonella deserti TaxID=2035528 RepID=A0ABQ1S7V5_9SPHN|nr:NAD(P)H-binding protein [Tsuneonella deserti]GGD97529.1 nucleoside-diphosphate sugar epimerase [Tsuneonella deserti]
MSDPLRIALVGATGLIGSEVMKLAVRREDMRLVAVARRESPLPQGARMEMFVADPSKWGEVFEAVRPQALICAVGTTWRKSGRDEDAFRAVDYDLVLATARAAKAAGIERMVAVSSTGADEMSKNRYLRTKGEVERELGRMKFKRLDILRPGLLKGQRIGDLRPLERLGSALSPLADLAMQGRWRAYRSIRAELVAKAALALTMRRAAGRFVHDNDAMLRAAATLPMPEGA